MDAPALPSQMHVFVRDWLSANHVLLKSPHGHVLIDSGYGRHSALTLALVASAHGIGNEPLAGLVNTHCHSDHIGGNAALIARYGCPVSLPAGEFPVVERWDTRELLLDYGGQHCERFRADHALHPGTTQEWGDLEWQVHAAPGHAMRAVVYFNPEHGILISGDALWEHGFGFVMPAVLDPSALPATRATLEMIDALEVRTVIPGHGGVFGDVDAALERAFRRVDAFEADQARVARHALKALLTFTLLDRRSLPLSALPAYVAETGFFRDVNALCFGLSPDALAQLLVAELVKVGAARCEAGNLIPTA